ncbi:MAG TPA: PAS domain S-box protein [Gemmatimonadaceae bacterium]|nr:PAS domain S-box protein [Gemmatimonadaceae bacterium]
MTKETPPHRPTPEHGVPPGADDRRGGTAGPQRAAQPPEWLYRLLVESVRDYAIFALDRAGNVLTWSAGAAKLKGYTRPEILGRHFSIFYPPEDVAAGKPDRELEDATRAGRLEDEGWRVRKDGTRFWATVVITALRDELGTLVGFAKVTRDHTERYRDEEALRASEARFRLLVESVRDYAIFLLDPGGHVATWNAGAERIKGYKVGDIVGRHFSVFYPEGKIAEGFPQYELEVAGRVGRFEDEGWRVRKDGSQFWANVVITALRDETGELVGFAKVTRDLTERRAAEEQARRLAAEEAARAEAERQGDELRHLTEQLQNQAMELEQQTEEAQSLTEELEVANDSLVRSEAAARDALARFQGVFNSRVFGLSVFDANVGRTVAVNDYLLELLGYTREAFDLNGLDWRNVTPPEYHEAEARSLQHLLEVGRAEPFEKEYVGKGGARIPVSVSGAPIPGLPGQYAVFVEDITERRRAQARAAHAAGRTEQLQALTAALAGAHTVEDVAEVVVAQAVAAMGAKTGAFLVREPGADEAVIVREAGFTADILETYRRMPLTTPGPGAESLRTGDPVWVTGEGDDTLAARYPALAGLWEGFRVSAVATVPLVAGGRAVGAMSFTFAEPRGLPAEDREFFLALGRQAAQAVERARLFEAERDARRLAEAAERRVAFLAEASARLAASLDVEATLQTVAELAVPALADWCFIEVLERGRVRPAAVAHANPEMVRLAHDVLARYPIDPDAPFGTGKVLRTGEPELNPEIPDDALAAVAHDEEHLAIIRQIGFTSSLSVPLEDAEGRAVAVLSLVSAESGRRFGEADLTMAQEVARRASAALASARLYAAGQAALRRATALQAVSGALVGALTAAEVAQVVVHHGCAAVGAAAGSFAALVDDGRTFDVLASEGYEGETAATFARFPATPGRPLSDAVLGGAPRYLSSLDDADAQYSEMAPVLRSTGFEGFVALPVQSGNRPAAGLSFSFANRREFDAEDRAFLETLAAQAGQALERARLVEAERAARAEAEAASRVKSEFLATMSHELRTPLNAIGGYAQLLEMGLRGAVSDAQRADLERIQRSQRHLLSVINEVLNYARLESGAVTYDVRPTVVGDVVATTIPLVEPQRAAKRLALEVRLPELGGRPGLHVLADRDKLQQVLLNLLSNAVKFTPEGGRVIVEFLPEPDARGMAEVRVIDNGVGIPADKLDAIFEPFVQVGRSLNSPGEGTGLGLAISRDLARGMGGDLTVESEAGAGSTFTLALPCA